MNARVALAVAMGLGVACSPVPLGDGERLMVVKALASEVIVPALGDSAREAAALEQALRDLEGDPTPAHLEMARAAWGRARAPWKATAPLLFGPGRDVAGAVDWFPVERKKLDELLASAEPLDAAGVALLGASRRGFHAIELLLFDDEGYAAAPALEGPAGARRRGFLTALAGDIARRLADLQAAWSGGHLAAFTGPGRAGSSYATIDAAVDSVINESISAAERSTSLLARPLGLMTGGEPRPELAESLPSDNTAADLAASVRGIRDLYLGTRSGADGRGISALVKSRGLDLRMRAALDNAVTRLEAVPRPFRAALLARDPSVNAAYEAVRELRRLCATELVANLGATLKFSDNDGD
jgi:predicted lipoprotein